MGELIGCFLSHHIHRHRHRRQPQGCGKESSERAILSTFITISTSPPAKIYLEMINLMEKFAESFKPSPHALQRSQEWGREYNFVDCFRGWYFWKGNFRRRLIFLRLRVKGRKEIHQNVLLPHPPSRSPTPLFIRLKYDRENTLVGVSPS